MRCHVRAHDGSAWRLEADACGRRASPGLREVTNDRGVAMEAVRFFRFPLGFPHRLRGRHDFLYLSARPRRGCGLRPALPSVRYLPLSPRPQRRAASAAVAELLWCPLRCFSQAVAPDPTSRGQPIRSMQRRDFMPVEQRSSPTLAIPQGAHHARGMEGPSWPCHAL